MIARLITLILLISFTTSVSANDGRDKWPHKRSHGINYKKFHKKHHRAARKIHQCHYVD
jgi:hypothetical protein